MVNVYTWLVEFFDGYGVDSLACAHKEDVLEALRELFEDPWLDVEFWLNPCAFGDDVEFGEAHLLDDGAHGCLDRALPL